MSSPFTKSKYFYLLLFLTSTISVSAGVNIDSLKTAYQTTKKPTQSFAIINTLVEELLADNQKKLALHYAEKNLELAQQLNSDKYFIKSYFLLSNIYFLNSQFQATDSLLNIALSYDIEDKQQKILLLEKKYQVKHREGQATKGIQYLDEIRTLIGDDTLSTNMIQYYTSYGLYHYGKKEFFKGFDYLLKAKKITPLSNSNALQTINHNLSNFYYTINNYQKAKAIFEENLAISVSDNNYRNQLFALFGVAETNYLLENYDEAKKACFAAIKLKEEHQITVAFGFIYYILGLTYAEEVNYEEAIMLLNKGIKISIEQGENKELTDCLIGLSKVYLLKEDLKNALFHAKEADRLMEFNSEELNDMLSTIYAQSGQYELAYPFLLDNYTSFKREKTAHNIIAKLLDDKSQTEKQKEQKIFQEKLAKQRIINLFGFIATLLLGFIAVLIYRNRERLKHNHLLLLKNRTIEEQYKKLRISNEDRKDLNEAQEIARLGSWVYDYERKVMTGSNQLLSMLNITASDKNILGQFLDFIPNKHFSKVRNNVLTPKLSDSTLDFTFKLDNQQPKWFRLRGKTSLDEIDGKLKFLGTLQDITEGINKELQITELLDTLQQKNVDLEIKTEHLARSNKDLEQFAYAASHDLQEPLRTIGSFIDIIKEENEEILNEESHTYMNLVISAVKRMRALIDALLSYSTVGNIQFKLQEVHTNSLVQNTVNDFILKIKETNADIIINQLPKTIFVEPAQLGIVFHNLINNGLKFNVSSKPKIEIGSIEQENDHLFYVKDNGIGIGSKNYSKIFEVFKRLHRREHYAGTGIGLASVKQIIDKHNGKIWVESQLNQGSTFYFTIPKLTTSTK